MHIGYLAHWFYPETGALAGRAHELGRHWLASSCDVSVVTAMPNHPEGRIRDGYRGKRALVENVDGITVHRKWLIPIAKRTIGGTALNHGSFSAHAVLAALFRRCPSPDIWITTSPPLLTAAAGALIAQLQGVPFIFEVRDLWPDYFAEMGVLKNKWILDVLYRLEARLYRKAAAIVTVAESMRSRIIDQKGVDPDKVFAIPNGADLGKFSTSNDSHSAKRAELGLDDRFVVAYVGNHGLGQGLVSVIKAAGLLQRHEDIHFLFVGNGAQRDAVVGKATELRLRNVTLLETCPREDVPAFYSAADVCLVPLADVPAFRSTIPSKLFEIMASRRPVIGALAGESAELITRAKAGFVVPPERPEDLAEAILRMRDTPVDVRTQMGMNGRRHVEEHFDREKLAARYLDILRSVRSGSNSRGILHFK